MKRIVCIAIALLLAIGCAAAAEAPQLSENLLISARQAVSYLASGEYERLVTLLPFSDIAPGAAEWESFAANYTDLTNIQSSYAVGYWTGSYWIVAVPLQVPDSGSVEALVLGSEDGVSFIGYRYATWSQVESGYNASDHVIWNNEYIAGSPTIIGG